MPGRPPATAVSRRANKSKPAPFFPAPFRRPKFRLTGSPEENEANRRPPSDRAAEPRPNFPEIPVPPVSVVSARRSNLANRDRQQTRPRLRGQRHQENQP